MNWEVFVDTRAYSIPDLMEAALMRLPLFHKARLPDQTRYFYFVTPILVCVRSLPWLPTLADFLLPLISKTLAELKRNAFVGMWTDF